MTCIQIIGIALTIITVFGSLGHYRQFLSKHFVFLSPLRLSLSIMPPKFHCLLDMILDQLIDRTG